MELSEFRPTPKKHQLPNVPPNADDTEPLVQMPPVEHRPEVFVGRFTTYGILSSLIFTTIISSLLLAGSVRNWSASGPGGLYHIVTSNRASSQLVVQVLANFFGLIHITILCTLINYATRLRLSSTATSLDAIRFWHNLCSRRIEWRLPLQFFMPLLLFVMLMVVPSALWAGAITLVSTTKPVQQTVSSASYSDSSLVKEYPDRSGGDVPNLRTVLGYFTYNVGESLVGLLMQSASSATTVDGSVRQHAKLDNTRFTYFGRSYGVGAAVGLLDDDILSNPLVTQYTFQENGYNSQVNCIYNSSSDFFVSTVNSTEHTFIANGTLPNSDQIVGYYDYFGYTSGPLVSIGVPFYNDSQFATGHMFGIATGTHYSFLNSTQCTIDYIPTVFNVTVGVSGRNITVVPVSTDTVDMEPTGNLSHTVTRQFSLIATDQTGLYTSLVGESFNNSISDYNISIQTAGLDPPTAAEATLAGLTNSATAMIDDMLEAYAAAQIMVANSTSNTTGNVNVMALRFGEDIYIYAIAVVNALIVLLVLAEAIRTRGWKDLATFDYMDARSLIIETSRGGKDIAAATSLVGGVSTTSKVSPSANRSLGKIMVLHTDCKIVLAREPWVPEGSKSLSLKDAWSGRSSREMDLVVTDDNFI